MNRALIGNIGRYALHDGPGIRTTVFFKGCSLNCPWCHNPELISPGPEIFFSPERCIGCGDCMAVCPEDAIQLAGKEVVNRDRCTGCGLCCRECPSKALEPVGVMYTVEELVEILLRDRLFYESSGGGVTLSGGEPTEQLNFLGLLLQRLGDESIHTALESNGFFSWDPFEAACLEHLDLILFDVKIADPVEHREIIGKSNDLILANLARIVAARPEDVIVRIPLIPGYTATEKNIRELADLLHSCGVRRYSLLAYHPYGLAKAERVGRAFCATLPQKAMDRSELQRWHLFFKDMESINESASR